MLCENKVLKHLRQSYSFHASLNFAAILLCYSMISVSSYGLPMTNWKYYEHTAPSTRTFFRFDVFPVGMPLHSVLSCPRGFYIASVSYQVNFPRSVNRTKSHTTKLSLHHAAREYVKKRHTIHASSSDQLNTKESVYRINSIDHQNSNVADDRNETFSKVHSNMFTRQSQEVRSKGETQTRDVNKIFMSKKEKWLAKEMAGAVKEK